MHDLAWDHGSSLTSSNVIGSSCALCVDSAFVAVPATYGTFRSKNKRTGAIVALCLAMVPAILLAFVFEMLALFMQSGSVGGRSFQYFTYKLYGRIHCVCRALVVA